MAESAPVLLPALRGLVGPNRAAAITVDGDSLSSEALASSVAATAALLTGASSVAITAAATLDTVIGILAGLAAGVPVVTIPPDAGPMERSHILNDSGAELVFGEQIHVRRSTGGIALPSEPQSDRAALIIYTSGTTGAPKGAVLSRRAIGAALDGLASAWSWTPDDTLVHGLPLFHVHGLVLGVLGALRVGSGLVHTGRPTPESYAGAAHPSVGGSLYFGVPTVWGRVCAEPDAARALSGARLLVSGSAPLPMPVFEQLRFLTGHAPIERYGMTETLITVSTRADGERRPGWVGVPIAGVRSRLVLEDGTLALHDGMTIGELQITGDTLFDGYHGRPDATSASFDGPWFRTGDAAVIDSDGFHRIVGRQSIDIIKTGGYKVGAGEVEAALLGHPCVTEVAVVGLPDDDLGQRIVAFVVGEAVDPAALIRHVAGELSVHKRPREIRVVDSLPRNAMGKVQKRLLT